MLTFEDMQRIAEEAATAYSGGMPLNSIYEARGIDPEGVGQLCNVFLAMSLLDLIARVPYNVVLSTMFHAGFDLGFKVASELEMQRQANA